MVCTGFQDPALLKHDDLICVEHGGQAVRYGDDRIPLYKVAGEFLDESFCLWIEA